CVAVLHTFLRASLFVSVNGICQAPLKGSCSNLIKKPYNSSPRYKAPDGTREPFGSMEDQQQFQTHGRAAYRSLSATTILAHLKHQERGKYSQGFAQLSLQLSIKLIRIPPTAAPCSVL